MLVALERRLSAALRSMIIMQFVANQGGVWTGAFAPFHLHGWACVKVLASWIETVKTV